MSKKISKKPEIKSTVASAPKVENKKEEVKKYWDKNSTPKQELLYGKNHFILIAAGLALLVIGFFLMSGGNMPDENTWDPNIIYSFTRITLAPLVVLIGLGIVGYALIYNPKSDTDNSVESE